MYVKVKQGKVVKFPYALTDLIVENPYTSFPSNISDAIAADYDVYPVISDKEPSYDADTQRLEAGELYDENGQWRHGWKVVDISEEALAAKAAVVLEGKVTRAKNELFLSDWVEMPSVSAGEGPKLANKADFDIYRMQLRTIVVTKNPELVFPNKPDPIWA